MLEVQQGLQRQVKASEREESRFTPALVIPCFSRVHSLQRLLGSLLSAVYPNETTLILSVNGGGRAEVIDLAEKFEWPHGEKVVICREECLPIPKHLLACCGMAEEYGSIIILEDDLFVAPSFYKFSKAALEWYADDPAIAGIGLSNISLNVWNWQPFFPSSDPFDVFFAQAVAPWGQVWSKENWVAFRSWLDTENDNRLDVPWLPKKLRTWGLHLDTLMYKYVVETDRYFVYPKPGLLTNFSDAGAHFPRMNDFQVPLQLHDREIVLCSLKDSRAVYDAWFELRPWLLTDAHPELKSKEFCVDLYGTKDPTLVSAQYMLTVKPAKRPLTSFGLQLRPRELNVLLNMSGNEIVLARTEDVARCETKLRIGYREHYYSYSHLKIYQMTTAIFAKAFTRARRMIATRRFR